MVYMARAASAPSPSAEGATNGASGSGKTPTRAMRDLVAEVEKLLEGPVTMENQEERNVELEKLRAEMVKVQQEIDTENTRIGEFHTRIQDESDRLRANAWRLGLRQNAHEAVNHMRHLSRVPHKLMPTRLFTSPHTPGSPGIKKNPPPGEVDQAQLPPTQSPPAQASPQHFHTPQGHFSNPVDNMLGGTCNLEVLPIHGNTSIEIKYRNAIEMLKTVVVQQAQL